jgi:hypothetical protein
MKFANSIQLLSFPLSFAKDEKQWMERVLKRQKLDAEGQAHIALIQVCLIPPKILLKSLPLGFIGI